METYIIEQGRYAPPLDPRLGRHVRHDSRSRRYAYRPYARGVTSVRHERHIPVFDQGALGSCTGNAALGCLGTGTLYDTVPLGFNWSEAQAVEIYSAATVIDATDGTYPPTDTGSDGLSVAQVLKGFGWISGYRHAFTLAAGLAALQDTPLIVGIDWHTGMFDPDADGLVYPTGPVEGGHEIVWDEYDAKTGRVGFTNSWGETWGLNGRFTMRVDDFGHLLADDGDVTVFTPLTEPAPQPTPGQPIPTADRDVLALAKTVRTWRGAFTPILGCGPARQAVDTFLRAKGF